MEKAQKAEPFWKYLWAVWLGIHFLLFFLLSYPVFRILLSREKRYDAAHKLRVIWGKYILFMTGIRWKVEFESPLDPEQTYLFAPNHSSYLDIPSVAVMIPGHLAYMAKSELARIPLFGVFFRTIDIGVNRKSAIQSHKAFLEAGRRLQEGTSLVLFPEGTIPKEAPKLGKFKDGPFRLAIENGVPLVPVTLPDNHKRLPDQGKFVGSPGKMRMFVHRPISTAGLKPEDADALKQQVFFIIESKLSEYADNG